MDPWRRYLWLWVIVVSICASGIIALIFIIINKCISRQGKHTIKQLQRRTSTVNSNKYQERMPGANTPPLPPRTQFLTAEAQSYENLAEIPECDQDKGDYEEIVSDNEQDKGDYEQATPDYEQDKADYEQATPDYEQDKADYVQSIPDYEQDKADYVQSIPDYEQDKADYVQSIPDYEQDKAKQAVQHHEQSDYVKMEDEEEILLHPAGDSSSMDDYDDIGGEDESQGDEDYDDVA